MIAGNTALGVAACLLASVPPPAVLPCGAAPDGMACVPGGEFVRGSDDDAHHCTQRYGPRLQRRPNARPAAKVWLQTFYLDIYEVTYEQFARCIEAGACKPRPEDGKWGPRYSDFARPRQPITGVSWYQSQSYCQWLGKSLPTEAQWEGAARGPDGDPYPWGTSPATCAHAVIKMPALGRSCGVKKRGTSAIGRVVDVGSKPAGRYGIHDLIGNVEEWVADWYSDDYAACGQACAGIEPKGPCDGKVNCPGHHSKVVRGGSWYWEGSHATAIHRRPHLPANSPPKRFHHFGFRCAIGAEASARPQ